MHPQFLRQRHNVVALLQSGDGVLPERFWKFAHTFLGHLPPPSGAKCANSPCLNLGVQSNSARHSAVTADRKHTLPLRRLCWGFLSESSSTTVIVLVAIDARRTAIFGWSTNYQRVPGNGHRGTKEIVGISHLRDAILPSRSGTGTLLEANP
jgi:hypothetical protein